MIIYYAILHYIILHCTILYYTILYYTILYYTRQYAKMADDVNECMDNALNVIVSTTGSS